MTSPTPLFGAHHFHSAKWREITSKKPDVCPGKDPEDTLCKCPDVMYATRIRIVDGTTTHSRLYCGCCELDLAIAVFP